jgi:hypothetical protein
MRHFSNKIRFYGEGLLAPRPAPTLEDNPFPSLLIEYIRSYVPYWKPFFHPQPEDASCRGDRGPLITDVTSLPNRSILFILSEKKRLELTFAII